METTTVTAATATTPATTAATTPKNATSQEFIGSDARIVESSNPQIIGLNGTIINETKSMFALDTKKGVKLAAKADSVWEISIGDCPPVIIDGSTIQKRPFDRIGRGAGRRKSSGGESP